MAKLTFRKENQIKSSNFAKFILKIGQNLKYDKFSNYRVASLIYNGI